MFCPAHEIQGIPVEKGLAISAELKAAGPRPDQLVYQGMGSSRIRFKPLELLKVFRLRQLDPGLPCLSDRPQAWLLKKGRVIITMDAPDIASIG